MAALRMVYRYWVAILLVGVIVQFFLAGLGVFDVIGAADETAQDSEAIEDAFSPHGALGFFLFLGGVLLFLLSLGARLGRNRILLSLAVPLLIIVQGFLAGGGEEAAAIGGLHPVNGLIILGLVGYLTHGSWRRWTDLGEPVGEPQRERV
jgi:hypothetical protein